MTTHLSPTAQQRVGAAAQSAIDSFFHSEPLSSRIHPVERADSAVPAPVA